MVNKYFFSVAALLICKHSITWEGNMIFWRLVLVRWVQEEVLTPNRILKPIRNSYALLRVLTFMICSKRTQLIGSRRGFSSLLAVETGHNNTDYIYFLVVQFFSVLLYFLNFAVDFLKKNQLVRIDLMVIWIKLNSLVWAIVAKPYNTYLQLTLESVYYFKWKLSY